MGDNATEGVLCRASAACSFVAGDVGGTVDVPTAQPLDPSAAASDKGDTGPVSVGAPSRSSTPKASGGEALERARVIKQEWSHKPARTKRSERRARGFRQAWHNTSSGRSRLDRAALHYDLRQAPPLCGKSHGKHPPTAERLLLVLSLVGGGSGTWRRGCGGQSAEVEA
eukprot:973345-Prymnesium_polylepis.1